MASMIGDEHAPVTYSGPCSLAGYSIPDVLGPMSDTAKTLVSLNKRLYVL